MKKICTKCKINKSLEEYCKDIRNKDGKCSECKNCTIIRTTRYKKTDKGKLAQAKYEKSNKGKLMRVKTSIKYSKTDKGKLAHAKYAKSDKGKLAQAKYNKSDKGKLVKQRYYKTDKGKLLQTKNRHNKRNWKSKTLDNLTTKESNIIMFAQNYQCANPNCKCKYGRFFDMVEPTLDHIVPVSKGGGLTIKNIQYLCQSCNSKKLIQEIDYRTELHKYIINQFAIA